MNRAFTGLIQESVEVGQPAYEPVQPQAGLGDEPAVIALRFDAPLAEGEELLRAEAAAIAALDLVRRRRAASACATPSPASSARARPATSWSSAGA